MKDEIDRLSSISRAAMPESGENNMKFTMLDESGKKSKVKQQQVIQHESSFGSFG